MKEISKLIKKMKPSGNREFFNYASERPDVVSLGVGEPDFTTPKAIVDAAKKSLDEGKTFYTSNQVYLSCVENRIGLVLSKEKSNIVIGFSLDLKCRLIYFRHINTLEYVIF